MYVHNPKRGDEEVDLRVGVWKFSTRLGQAVVVEAEVDKGSISL